MLCLQVESEHPSARGEKKQRLIEEKVQEIAAEQARAAGKARDGSSAETAATAAPVSVRRPVSPRPCRTALTHDSTADGATSGATPAARELPVRPRRERQRPKRFAAADQPTGGTAPAEHPAAAHSRGRGSAADFPNAIQQAVAASAAAAAGADRVPDPGARRDAMPHAEAGGSAALLTTVPLWAEETIALMSDLGAWGHRPDPVPVVQLDSTFRLPASGSLGADAAGASASVTAGGAAGWEQRWPYALDPGGVGGGLGVLEVPGGACGGPQSVRDSAQHVVGGAGGALGRAPEAHWQLLAGACEPTRPRMAQDALNAAEGPAQGELLRGRPGGGACEAGEARDGGCGGGECPQVCEVCRGSSGRARCDRCEMMLEMVADKGVTPERLRSAFDELRVKGRRDDGVAVMHAALQSVRASESGGGGGQGVAARACRGGVALGGNPAATSAGAARVVRADGSPEPEVAGVMIAAAAISSPPCARAVAVEDLRTTGAGTGRAVGMLAELSAARRTPDATTAAPAGANCGGAPSTASSDSEQEDAPACGTTAGARPGASGPQDRVQLPEAAAAAAGLCTARGTRPPMRACCVCGQRNRGVWSLRCSRCNAMCEEIGGERAGENLRDAVVDLGPAADEAALVLHARRLQRLLYGADDASGDGDGADVARGEDPRHTGEARKMCRICGVRSCVERRKIVSSYCRECHRLQYKLGGQGVASLLRRAFERCGPDADSAALIQTAETMRREEAEGEAGVGEGVRASAAGAAESCEEAEGGSGGCGTVAAAAAARAVRPRDDSGAELAAAVCCAWEARNGGLSHAAAAAGTAAAGGLVRSATARSAGEVAMVAACPRGKVPGARRSTRGRAYRSTQHAAAAALPAVGGAVRQDGWRAFLHRSTLVALHSRVPETREVRFAVVCVGRGRRHRYLRFTLCNHSLRTSTRFRISSLRGGAVCVHSFTCLARIRSHLPL